MTGCRQNSPSYQSDCEKNAGRSCLQPFREHINGESSCHKLSNTDLIYFQSISDLYCHFFAHLDVRYIGPGHRSAETVVELGRHWALQCLLPAWHWQALSAQCLLEPQALGTGVPSKSVSLQCPVGHCV